MVEFALDEHRRRRGDCVGHSRLERRGVTFELGIVNRASSCYVGLKIRFLQKRAGLVAFIWQKGRRNNILKTRQIF